MDITILMHIMFGTFDLKGRKLKNKSRLDNDASKWCNCINLSYVLFEIRVMEKKTDGATK